jgi:hypothetical protein
MGKHSAIIFETTPTGCMVPTNKKLNADGYYRRRWADNTMEMFHRFIWRARKGEIPEGYEINHLCSNRACQNVDHMECIPGKDHAIKTNQERYAPIKEAAKRYWLEHRCTATELSQMFKRTTAFEWVREWKRGFE